MPDQLYLQLSTTEILQRYISEWDPRGKGKTKGGYLEGQIVVPSVEKNQELKMMLSIVPTEELVTEITEAFPHINENIAMAHPMLLHNVRIGRGKRKNELEPVPFNNSWKLFYILENGNVRICNEHNKIIDERDTIPLDPMEDDSIVTTYGEDNIIHLGKDSTKLNLIPLQPKQQSRAQKGREANIQDVLVHRLNLFGSNDIETLENIESFYYKKKGSKKGRDKNGVNIKKFRMRVDFFIDGKPTIREFSDEIKDTGNKKEGSMDIYDVINQKSCCMGGRKVCIVSEYSLAKEDVKPVLQIYDQDDNHVPEMEYLITPIQDKDVKVRNLTIHLLTPPQNYLNIHSLELDGYVIKLLLKRDTDGYESPNKYKFQYIQHQECPGMYMCPFCDLKVDDPIVIDEMQQMKQIKVELPEGLQSAQPHKKKRFLNAKRSDKDCKRSRSSSSSPAYSVSSSGASPSSVGSQSPEYQVQLSPESGFETMNSSGEEEEELQNFVNEFPTALTVDNGLYQSLNLDSVKQPIRIESISIKVITNYSTDLQITPVPTTVNEECEIMDNSESLNTPIIDFAMNPLFDKVLSTIEMDNAQAKSIDVIDEKTQTNETKTLKVPKKKIQNEEEDSNALVEIQMFIFMMLLLMMVMNMVLNVPNFVMMIITAMSAIICTVLYNKDFFFGRDKGVPK